jgi:hypothetical protein
MCVGLLLCLLGLYTDRHTHIDMTRTHTHTLLLLPSQHSSTDIFLTHKRPLTHINNRNPMNHSVLLLAHPIPLLPPPPHSPPPPHPPLPPPPSAAAAASFRHLQRGRRASGNRWGKRYRKNYQSSPLSDCRARGERGNSCGRCIPVLPPLPFLSPSLPLYPCLPASLPLSLPPSLTFTFALTLALPLASFSLSLSVSLHLYSAVERHLSSGPLIDLPLNCFFCRRAEERLCRLRVSVSGLSVSVSSLRVAGIVLGPFFVCVVTRRSFGVFIPATRHSSNFHGIFCILISPNPES